MSGRNQANQAMEIFTHILDHGPVAAADVEEATGWNRHVVDVAIDELRREGMVEQEGQAPWGEPLWRSTSNFGRR